MGEKVTNGDFATGTMAGWTGTSSCGEDSYFLEANIVDGKTCCSCQSWLDHCTTYFSQSVDLTNVDHLTFLAQWFLAYWSEDPPYGLGQVLIDGNVVFSASGDIETWTAYDIDVSSYSGSCVIRFEVISEEYGVGCEITDVSAIDVPPAPVAEFSGTPLAIQAPGYVQFTDESTNIPTSWLWDFGDNSTQSVQQSPMHRYVQVGTFTVTLTATNAYGSDSETKINYVTTTLLPPGGAPVAEFSGTPLLGNAPLSVTFTDASTGAPTSWIWDFGDGMTATSQNPTHIYTIGGTFDVALQAINAFGSSTRTKVGYVIVGTCTGCPVANFTGTPLSGIVPLTVTFIDSSTATPTSWLWNFGDTETSTSQNPVHEYHYTGYYTVKLTATNANGSGFKQRTNYVWVKPIAPIPVDPPVPPIGKQSNPADGAISFQLNSLTSSESIGSQYDHLMALREITNYDLRTRP